jgi:hypothetical protein
MSGLQKRGLVDRQTGGRVREEEEGTMRRTVWYVAIVAMSLFALGGAASAQGPLAAPAGAVPAVHVGASVAAGGDPAVARGMGGMLNPDGLPGIKLGTAIGSSPLIGGDGKGGFVLLLVGRGRGPNVSADPSRTMFSVPLYNLSTGEQVGMSHHNFTDIAPFKAQDLDTYELPQGTITRDAVVSFAPDSQDPGWVMDSVHKADEVRTLTGTGIFAGRHLDFRLEGLADLSKLPTEVGLNELYVITVR